MNPISARLESLAELHRVSPLLLLEFFEERAAIRQYEGGYTRTEADKLALGDVEAWLEGRR